MQEESIDYMALVRKSLRYWYFFVLFILLAAATVYYILKTTHPQYRASAILLIKDDKESGQLSEESLFNELGLGNANKNLENEMNILRSTPILLQAVQKLRLNYQYFQVQPLTERVLYKDSPIQVAHWAPKPGQPTINGFLRPTHTGHYTLDIEIEDLEMSYEGEFGRPLQLPWGELILTKDFNGPVEYPIRLRITRPWARAKEIKEQLEVSRVGEESSLVKISIKDTSPARAEDLLNQMIEGYNRQTIDSRNTVFKNTIDLINERIGIINQELTEVEMNVEEYKSSNSMIELNSEGSLLMEELATYNREITDIEVQLTILKSIEDFLVTNQEKFEFVPTNATLNNLTLTGQLTSFNQLLADRDRLRTKLGSQHPDLILVENQIQNLRQSIIDNIRTIKNDLLVAKESSQGLKDNLENRIQTMPRRERELVEIERKRGVKENLYVYLLQKREESAISMAVTMPKGIIVEPPEAESKPFKPNLPKMVFIGGILGLALPLGIVFILLQFNNKIETEHDLTGLTTLNVAGVLSEMPNSKSGQTVIQENSRTTLAEMFRMLRANLSYILPGKNMQTLLVSSTISGEGKSFISLNLGITMALTGKKVVLLETDLRKPRGGVQLSKKTEGNAPDFGVVNFVIDPDCRIENIVKSSEFHPNLDIISCGPKPPNPGELIMSERMGVLIEELKMRYDFIILDSPPIGILADAFHLGKLADATMLVVRSRYTNKGHIDILNDVFKKKKVPHPFVVLNAVALKSYQYGKYGYGYGYTSPKSKEYFSETT